MKLINLDTNISKNNITIKCQKHQTVSRQEVETMTSKSSQGFLPINVTEKHGSAFLCYDLSGLIPLSDYLTNVVLSKRLLVYLLKQFVNFDKNINDLHFKINSVLFDFQYIFISPDNWKLYFVYVPAQPFQGCGNFRTTLQNFVSYIMFDGNEDLQYVKDYINLVKNDVAFSKFLLEEFIEKNQTPNYRNAVESHKQIESNKINSVNDSSLDMVVVFKGAKNVEKRKIILRGNGENIVIDKFPFRIGKQAGIVDYRIINSTVSRKHADIVREGEKYYIIDLESTNGTFINGRKIQCGVKEQLVSGCTVTFSNISYEFVIEEVSNVS